MTETVEVFYYKMFGRQELVDGWVEKTNRNRQGRHNSEDSTEVFALDREQPVKSELPVFRGVGNDHFDHDRQPLGAVKHPLSSAETDTHSPEFQRTFRVIGSIRIRHHFEPCHSVRHGQETGKFRGEFRFDHRDFAKVDRTGRSVDRDQRTFPKLLVARPGPAHGHIDEDALGTRYAGFTHPPGYHRRMGSLAAPACQDSLRGKESMNILWLCLLPDKDNAFTGTAQFFGPVRIEHGNADCNTG